MSQDKPPRKLRVLRIDDRAVARRSPSGDSAADLADRPPAAIDVVHFGPNEDPFVAIASWNLAIQYWQPYTSGARPDLVVADVLFDHDATTPLTLSAADKLIPTGLSHVKPFGAVSRALGSPIGIGIHTANPDLWKNLLDLRKGPVKKPVETVAVQRAMALLAAHEIAELAGILGDSPLELLVQPTDQQLTWCWGWLHSRTSSEFRGALGRALTDYRRRLIAQSRGGLEESRTARSIYVMPGDWVRLSSWCAGMQGSPRPIGDNDIGLAFITSEGVRDCILIQSLFADVDPEVCDIMADTLPAACFEVSDAAKPWELAESGLPWIGPVIHQLRSLSDAASEAATLLDSFPADPQETGGAESLTAAKRKPLVRGLAILFALVRRDRENFLIWQEAYERAEWHLNTMEFTASQVRSHTLEETLRCITGYVPNRTSASFDANDLLEEAEAEPLKKLSAPTAIKWHFNLLCSAGVLERVADQEGLLTYRATGHELQVPPVPSPTPKGVELTGADYGTYLKAVFGFRMDNDNSIADSLSQAFDLGGRNAGRAFLREFVTDGSCPTWVREVCRDYARHRCGWGDPSTWPPYLRE